MSLLLIFVCLSCTDTEELVPEIEEKSETLSEDNEGLGEDELLLLQSSESFRLGPWNIIYEETFEETFLEKIPFYAYVHKQLAGNHSLRTATSPSFRGERSGRFELRINDPIVTSSGQRAEILFTERPTHKERWYSFALYLPSNGFSKDSQADVISQWFEGGSPPISLRVLNDNFRLRLLDRNSNIDNINIAPASKNTWHEFVFHIIHSGSGDGLIEVWHNGNKVITKRGANNFSSNFPTWKVGIYKPTWKRIGSNNIRIAYFDNVRIGHENSSYDEIRPSKDNTNDWGPAIPDIGTLTLLNAQTNREVKTISNEESISTRMLNTNRISIKADMGKDFTGSVKFDLKGPKNFSHYDNASPYTLFGDNGGGNYYNGGGLPLGNYTLTITPYDDRNGRGKVGNPKTITFKVVNSDVADNSMPMINGFTLIQANIDRKWGSISDGQTVSVTDTHTDKLSIEADMPSSFNGRVRFELTGRVNRVSTASSAPYTLYNYRDGDYTFGATGLPVGEYKLDATPIIVEDGETQQGETQTIRFRVVE